MKATQLLIFVLSVAAANSAQLACDFRPNFSELGYEYICSGNITSTRADYLIDGVSGTHADGRGNDDVTTVMFSLMTMEVAPRNLKAYFKNFKKLSLIAIDILPNFKRSDFYDFTQLTDFYAAYMDSVTKLPRDTFFDMKRLQSLCLDIMPNMENFDVDLLVNLRELTLFSAAGPNKINQISPGFFRNQMETLRAVNFDGTKLIRVGHSVFVNLQASFIGRFFVSGCLDDIYKKADLNALIRANCQDVILKENEIT